MLNQIYYLKNGTFVRVYVNHIIKITSTVHINENNIENCCICLDQKSNVITNCDNQYCATCINIWLNIDSYCPMCRTCVSNSP